MTAAKADEVRRTFARPNNEACDDALLAVEAS